MTLILPRRSIIKGLGSLLVAPAIIRAEHLMPVKLMTPDGPLVVCVGPGRTFQTIKEAVEYVQLVAGSRKAAMIKLDSGIYQENVVMPRQVECSLLVRGAEYVDIRNSEFVSHNKREPLFRAELNAVLNVGNSTFVVDGGRKP
jgi:pectin methylesterase-like acyl-CoA thioesterase